MTQEEYLSQFSNMDDYMAAVQKDYQDEFGKPMDGGMCFLAYKIGCERFEPERFQRIFCN